MLNQEQIETIQTAVSNGQSNIENGHQEWMKTDETLSGWNEFIRVNLLDSGVITQEQFDDEFYEIAQECENALGN